MVLIMGYSFRFFACRVWRFHLDSWCGFQIFWDIVQVLILRGVRDSRYWSRLVKGHAAMTIAHLHSRPHLQEVN